MITALDEIERKTLDQMASLVSSFEAGKISKEALETAFETIWCCLSGVIKTREFNDIMHEANHYLRSIKKKKVILADEDDILIS